MEELRPDSFEELQRLQDIREGLVADLNTAPDRLKPTFGLALKTAETAFAVALQAESIQDKTQQLEEQLQQDIELVHSLLQRGLLTSEQAENELERIPAHEDYKLLRLVRQLGDTTLQPISPTPAEAPSEPVLTFIEPPVPQPSLRKSSPPGLRQRAQSRPRKQSTPAVPPVRKAPERPARTEIPASAERLGNVVRATITDKAIIINGKTLANTLALGSNSRNAALLRTISRLRPGVEISATELWELSVPSVPVNKEHLRVFRGWLQKNLKTESGRPLLVHNGQKGVASRYIYQPDTYLELLDETVPLVTAETPEDGNRIEPLPISPGETFKAPNAYEQELIRRVVNNVARQIHGESADQIQALSNYPAVDFSALDSEQLGRLLSSGLHKMKKLATSTQTREEYHRYASRNKDDIAAAFMRVITPVLQQYINLVDDETFLGVAQQILAENKA